MLYFHYPIHLVVKGKTIFSNMRFINNQILLTGAGYLYSPIDYDKIFYFIDNQQQFPKIIERRAYEPSVLCLFENDEWKNNEFLCLRIIYQDISNEYIITKEHYQKYTFVATTLFKDDYPMLDLYIDYYSKMGIECFFLYYNGKIDEKMFDHLKNFSTPIHITEWNYPYWLHDNPKRDHHAQMMAIIDALYLGKNTSKYCLFNDLDEYLDLDKSLQQLVNTHPQISNFNFDCHWATIGKELVDYREAKEKFYCLQLFWNKVSCGINRRKSLIRLENVDIMRVHFPDVGKNIQTLYLPKFYHICNFQKWDRRFFYENNIIQSEQNRIAPSDIITENFLTQEKIQPYDRYICNNLEQIEHIKFFVKEVWSRKKDLIEGFEYIGPHKDFTEFYVYERKITTKVGFEYFWDNFFTLSERLFLIYLLSLIPNSLFELNIHECDVIYHSYFRNPFTDKKENKKYIFFSGEKYDIPIEQYTLSICQKEDTNKVVCYPFFFTMLHSHSPRYNMVLSENNNTKHPEHFCAFIVGNPSCQLRTFFFQYLSKKYKNVHSYGKVLNNVGYVADFLYNDKRQLELLSKHKFVICFENTKTDDYYITEKLLIAKAAGCIPIYWGTTKCLELFDKNAFLYLDDDTINGMDKLISKIKMIDNNDRLYLDMRRRPLLTKQTVEKFSKSNLINKIESYL